MKNKLYTNAKSSVLAWFFLIVIGALSACTELKDEPIKLGTNDWPGYRPFYLAQQLEYIGSDDFHLIELTSASEALRNFRNGVIDAAALTLDEALLLKQDGIDFKIILVTDISNGGDAIVANNAVSTMKGLVGKKVGLEKTALGAYVLARALDVSGMSVEDIEMIPVEYSEHQSAFVSGMVDAVVTFDPVRSHLLAKGGSVVFDSTQLPGEIVDVLIVGQQYYEKHPSKIKKLLNAWFRALASLNDDRANAIQVLSPMSNLSSAEYEDALSKIIFPDHDDNVKMLGSGKHSLLPVIDKLKQVMLDKNLLERDVDTDSMFSNKYLLALDK